MKVTKYKKPVLSKSVKKTKSRALSNKATVFSVKNRPIKKKVNGLLVVKGSPQLVNVKIIEHALDIYRSPHTINLSQAKFIEKIKPQEAKAPEPDDLLTQGLNYLGILDFYDYRRSPIGNGLKLAWNRLADKNNPNSIDMSTKLPLATVRSTDLDAISYWREVGLVDVLVATWFGIKNLIEHGRHFFRVANHHVKNSFNSDEIFKLEKEHESLPEAYLPVEPLKNVDDKLTKAVLALQEILSSFEKVENKKEEPELVDIFASKQSEMVNLLKQFDAPKKQVTVRAESIFKNISEKIWYKKVDKVVDFLTKPLWNKKVASQEAKSKPFFKYDLEFISPLRTFKWSSALWFVAILVIIVVPIKLSSYWQKVNTVKIGVLKEAEQAVSILSLAKDEFFKFNFTQASELVDEASVHFDSANNQLAEINSLLTVLAENSPIDNPYRSGKNLLELGQHLSVAGKNLLSAINIVADQKDLTLTKKIAILDSRISVIISELSQAQENLSTIDIVGLPDENQEQFRLLKNKLPWFIENLQKGKEILTFSKYFLADNDLKRYLVVFQNSNELRASGGFMGSFALVDIESGKISKMQLPGGGTYDVRAGFNQLIKAPEPLTLMTPRWEFQDANWWPDFPTSAKNMAWFYEKSGGPTVDGVIAINSDWLGEILKITGPIDLPEYGKTVTADNFVTVLQNEVEVNYKDKAQPKKILADLAPKLLDKLMNFGYANSLDLLKVMSSGLTDRDLQIFVTNPDWQKMIAEYGWDGKQIDFSGDYLQVINTNIAGNKTDQVVTEKIEHQATISEDGSIIDRVIISRHHFGPVDERFTNTPNRSYIRVYVPEGSQLIDAAGFVAPKASEFEATPSYLKDAERLSNENNAVVDAVSGVKTYVENGKTVFANWLVINPGEAREVVLTYKLPIKVDTKIISSNNWLAKIGLDSGKVVNSYHLLLQKQSGSGSDDIYSEVNFPVSYSVGQATPANINLNGNKAVYKGVLDKDIFYSLDFNHN